MVCNLSLALHPGGLALKNGFPFEAATDFGKAPAQIVVLSPKATFELENDGRKTKRDALDGVDEYGNRKLATQDLASREMLAVVKQLQILVKRRLK